jgi:hypothetical protein
MLSGQMETNPLGGQVFLKIGGVASYRKPECGEEGG